MNGGWFAILIVLGLLAFAVLIIVSPLPHATGIFGFMDPWGDAFRATSCRTAHRLRPGRIFGVGLGASGRKLFYLPGAYRFPARGDCRGTGPRRRDPVVALFACWCIALCHRPPGRSRSIASSGARREGIGIWLGVQGFINMGVNMGLLPTKGLTLPLMSFGGSGILANCVALAILLRVDWENRRLMRGQTVSANERAPAPHGHGAAPAATSAGAGRWPIP